MVLGRVEVAGSIASGKTTLVEALPEDRFKRVYEDHALNPFWEAFYTDPSACTFETEITFLLQHYHFAKLGVKGPRASIVLDHSFELDVAYAKVGLVGRRRELFESIYREIQSEIGPPQAIIFVSCNTDELARRIRERGRPLEAKVPLGFLSRLECALQRRIDELHGLVPIIRVDSEKTDFRSAGGWLSSLVTMLSGEGKLESLRRYQLA